ncbi:hypothetical protein BDV28DRAFT_116867 [Aspergillus coremiiformis]|uniref:BZIP domain-containing protein n=1 Tax=Aspergillus coremiiformis TaxID=138285 RepID=A0A5N6ZFA5_9EURO|nr:hypothetical protein BDV28DRAFT_116867 [Aspergillus coremiiformis]
MDNSPDRQFPALNLAFHDDPPPLADLWPSALFTASHPSDRAHFEMLKHLDKTLQPASRFDVPIVSPAHSPKNTEQSPIPADPPHATKMDRRRDQNRAAQRRFRQRKEDELKTLKESVEKLEGRLQTLLGLYLDQARALSGLIQTVVKNNAG